MDALEEAKLEKKALKEIEQTIKKEQNKSQPKKVKEKFGHRVHPEPKKIIHCRATFIEDVLGSHPGSEQLFSDYITSKAPDAATVREEIELYGAEEVEDIRTTKFPRDKDGDPCIIGYQLRGFTKGAAQALKRAEQLTITAHNKVITDMVKYSAVPDFNPIQRYIKLIPPKGKSMYLCQRPLRGKNGMVEVNSIASSEALPAGTTFEFYMQLMHEDLEGAALSWLEFGKIVGVGQWRSAGYGRFTVEVEEDGVWVPIEEVG